MANTMTARKDRRSWWQRFWRVAAQPAQPVSVGMDGLPAGVGVLPVGAPAVLLAADEASSQVWGPLVLQSLLAAGPVLVLASSAQQADALWQHAPLRQAYAAGQLQVMLFPAKQQAVLRQENLGAWASEVRRAGLAAGASLCVLDARAMFLGAAQAQLRSLGGQLRRFAKRHAWPIVLMLPLAPPSQCGGRCPAGLFGRGGTAGQRGPFGQPGPGPCGHAGAHRRPSSVGPAQLGWPPGGDVSYAL